MMHCTLIHKNEVQIEFKLLVNPLFCDQHHPSLSINYANSLEESTYQLEGLILAMIVVFEFPPNES